jgi:hypothetical protein
VAWIGAVTSLVSGGVGLAQSAQGEGQSRAERAFSAELAGENARMVGDQTAAAEAAQRREARAILSRQAAAISESGTGEGGSNALIQAQDAALAELDALNLRYGGRVRMASLDAEALRLRAQKPSMEPLSWRIFRMNKPALFGGKAGSASDPFAPAFDGFSRQIGS